MNLARLIKTPIRKIATALRLLAGGEADRILIRIRYNLRVARLNRHAGKPFLYKIAGSRFLCDPGLHDSLTTYLEEPLDLSERAILRHWLRRGDIMIDGGANIGVYASGGAGAVGREGLVVAVEPSPDLVGHLRSAARHLGYRHLQVAECGLFNKTGRVDFAIAPEGETTTCQSLVGSEFPSNTGKIISIETTTFAALADAHLAGRQPAAVKLDIEGAEMQALQSVPPVWLERDGPLWLVECNDPVLKRFGATIQEVIAVFPDEHFERWIVPKWPALASDDHPWLFDGRFLPGALFYNLIAIPRGERWKGRRNAILRLLKRGSR